MFSLDTFNPDAEYAIFDDWEDWDRFYNYKQFLGAQEEFVVSDKYRKKRTIRWGKPCIVISNTLPAFKDMDWIHLNCVIYYVNEPLFETQ